MNALVRNFLVALFFGIVASGIAFGYCFGPPGDCDGDGVADAVDNCPYHANPNQRDRGQLTMGHETSISTFNSAAVVLNMLGRTPSIQMARFSEILDAGVLAPGRDLRIIGDIDGDGPTIGRGFWVKSATMIGWIEF